jgi:hypothetical protein
MTVPTSVTSSSLMKKLRAYCPNLFNKDAIDLVFGAMLIFMLTCIGSMLIICFFFELEKRIPSPHSDVEQSSTLPNSNVSTCSK